MDGPDIFFGDCNPLRKTTVAIDSQDVHVFTNVSLARAAGLAPAAANMTFSANSVTHLGASDRCPGFFYNSNEFMPGGDSQFHTASTPGIPFKDVSICSAYPGMSHADQDLAGADGRDFRFGRPGQSWSRFGFFDRQHVGRGL